MTDKVEGFQVLRIQDVEFHDLREDIGARKLRIELLEQLGSEDYCLMSRNAWVYFIDKDKEFLRTKGVL
jgi:hypothetical protein